MDHLFPASSSVPAEERQKLFGHQPLVIWMTGLSGAGKTTLALLLEQQFHSRGIKTALLDGDKLRKGLNKDLDFSAEGRAENVRRTAEVCRILKDAGLVTIASLISPYKKDRDLARSVVGPGFIEVFVDCSIEECERRDVKGLYAKAKGGEVKNFTGVSSDYEKPERPDLIIKTDQVSIQQSLQQLLGFLLPLIGFTDSSDRNPS